MKSGKKIPNLLGLVAAAAILVASSSAFAQGAPDFWDPELDAMGASWQAPALSPGQEYWKLISAEYIDENESGGLHHMFYKCLDLGGNQLADVRIVQEWDGGSTDALSKAYPDWGDIAMWGSGWCPTYPNPRSCPPGPYTGSVGDGRPSYRLAGCGMPANHHVCYEMIFQLAIAGGAAATSTPTSPPGPTNTPPPSGSNLLVNPGAETNDYTGWTQSGMRIDPDTHIPFPANHSGSHRFGAAAGWSTIEAYMYQQVSVTPGQEHEAGVYLCEMDGTNESMEMYWVDGPYGGTENVLYSTTPAGTYPSWHEFSGARFTPSGSTVTLLLRFHHTDASEIAVWHVDDIYLRAVGEQPPTFTPEATSTPAPTSTPKPTNTEGPSPTVTSTRPPGEITWIMIEDGETNPTTNGNWPETTDDTSTVTANLSGDTPAGDNRFLNITNTTEKIKIRQEPSFLNDTGSTLRLIMRINSGGNAGNYGFEHQESFGTMEIGYQKNPGNDDGVIQLINGDPASTTQMAVPNINQWHAYWFVHSTNGNTYFWLDPTWSDDSYATADLVKTNGAGSTNRLTWGTESTGQAVNQDIDDARWALGDHFPSEDDELIVIATVTPTPTPTTTNTPMGQPYWKLSYARQYGEDLTAGVAGQAELFATWENGDYADAGMTNEANPGIAIFGYTGDASNDPYTPGNSRVNFDIANDRYDFHVYDPSADSDSSPYCYWLDGLPHYGHYRFEFWWRKVADDALYEFFPTQPVYHYDLVNGFNNPPSEPPGFSSDASSLSDWAEYQAQTFVVPAGINRIIGAKCFGDKGFAQKFRMVFSIRQGGPTGPQVGPSVTAREKDSNEYPNVKVAWGMNDVPVTPGGTYALRVEVLGGGGMNVHATNNNTYANGMLYNGASAVPGRDMVAVVVGARCIAQPTPPTPTPTPPTVPPTASPSPTEPIVVSTPTVTPTFHHGGLLNPALDEFADPSDVADYWQSWAGMGSPDYLAEGAWWRHTQEEGARSQRWWADGIGYDSGIRQEVAAIPGAVYRFTAWFHHYEAQVGNGPVNFYVGIDPNGGFQPLQAVWSDPVPKSDSWEEVSVEVAATGSTITVYGRCSAEGPSVGGERSTFMDDCSLLVVSEPDTPTPTDTPDATNTVPPTPSEDRYPDLFGFSQGWQRGSNETPFYQPQYDFNGDDRIDEYDLYLFVQRWRGLLEPPPTPTPTEHVDIFTSTPTSALPTSTNTPVPPTATQTPSDIIYENHFEVFQDFNPGGGWTPGSWSPPPAVVLTVDRQPRPDLVNWGGEWQPFDILENPNGITGSCQEIRIRDQPVATLHAYVLSFEFSGEYELSPGRYEASVWVKSNFSGTTEEYTHTTIGHSTCGLPETGTYVMDGWYLTDWYQVSIEFDVFPGEGGRCVLLPFGGHPGDNPDGYVAGYFDDLVIRKIW